METHAKEKKLLLPFFLITFGIAWGVPGLLLLLSSYLGFSISLAEGAPLSFLYVWAPAISAFTVILVRTGWRGLIRYLKKILTISGHWGWYLLLLVFFPMISLVSSLLSGLTGGPGFVAPQISASAFLLAVLSTGIYGPFEELGWRGFALPLLQRRYGGLTAAVILGFIWALWHVPAFFLPTIMTGAMEGGALIVLLRFFIGTIVTSVFITVLYNGTGGCVLAAFLYHWIMNLPYPWEARSGISLMQDMVSMVLLSILLLSSLRKKYLFKDNLATAVISDI